MLNIARNVICPGLLQSDRPLRRPEPPAAGRGRRTSGSSQAALISGWRLPGRLAERGGERAGLAESDRQADIGYRQLRLGQERLGLLDASAVVIPVGRHPQRLLERPAEIIGTQANETRKRGERYLLGEMFLDIRGHDPLLPARKAAPHRSFDRTDPGIEADELMRQDDTKGLEIKPVVGGGALDLLAQLDRRIP